MKIWVKFFVATVLGIILGFLLPGDNQLIMGSLAWLANLAIRIGRYAAAPALLFSLIIAISKLRQEGGFWGLLIRALVLMAGIAVFVISLGILVTHLFPPARIPIQIEEQGIVEGLNIPGMVNDLIPSNMMAVLAGDGIYLLPLYLFAFFLAIGLSYDKTYTKPVIALIDSLSRIFYHVISFFSEIFSPVLIVLAAYWAVRYREVLQAGIFRDLILLLALFSAVLAFVILPLFFLLLGRKSHPWRQAYGSLGPALAAFFSGDINFSLPVLLRNTGENLGVRRRVNAPALTLFTSFGRSGSAMVAASAFIVIVKSYSSLGIDMMDILSIGLQALAISFLLARHPGDGAYTALTVIATGYGRGFEAGYLILKPLAFYLIAIGAFLDVMIAGYASFALAKLTKNQEEKSIRQFI
ncbi:MAG: cation:dicarboxylase symporter family transporter [Treponema sp.]|jgi:Na+/H+-dicarboxylate symporter|nr:cation:dicarboxylase symporter family transporter [Treponema sp.]